MYAQRLLRESLLMPAYLSNEEGKLICSQLGTVGTETIKPQTVGMDFLFPLYFFSFPFLVFFVGTSHERAVVAIFLHAASEQHVINNI
jgi:predicted branched-subunit amino acid permease